MTDIDTDSIDVDVTDGEPEMVTMTRAEFDRALETVKNATWAEARKTFQGKRERSGDLAARVERLERIIANHLDESFVGQAAPLSTSREKAES